MWGVVAAAILHLASHRAGSEPPINGKIGCVESYVCSKKTMLMEPHRLVRLKILEERSSARHTRLSERYARP
jgi:hypothetical protein